MNWLFASPAWMSRRLAVLAVGILVVAGCSAGPKRAGPVDADLARQALRQTLDAWKNGETLQSLRDSAPPVTAQDVDWMSGQVLVEYEIVGDGKDDDCNLRCPVRLVLRDPNGNKVEKKVTYMIGTDPAITVFREIKM